MLLQQIFLRKDKECSHHLAEPRRIHCTATSFLGVILAIGWLGGAIAAHVRIKDKFVAPAIILILIWIVFGLRHQPEVHSLRGF